MMQVASGTHHLEDLDLESYYLGSPAPPPHCRTCTCFCHPPEQPQPDSERKPKLQAVSTPPPKPVNMDLPPLPTPPSGSQVWAPQQEIVTISSSPVPHPFDDAQELFVDAETDPDPYFPSSPPGPPGEDEELEDAPPKPPPPPPDEPPLSEEQEKLVNLILTGRNVFYTGAAGTGKSRVLREFVKKLRDKGKVVHVAAPTGKAALAVGGSTTWTYAGISPASIVTPLQKLRLRARGAKRTRQRIGETDCLVIDEVSMVENHQLERINHIMQASRSVPLYGKIQPYEAKENSGLPFGGCQVIVTGDFCQLPPVKAFQICLFCGVEMEHEEVDDGMDVITTHRCHQCHRAWPDSDKWAFKSMAWDLANFAHVELRTVHRQAGDPRFINILNNLRKGKPPSPEDSKLLMDPNRGVKTGNAIRLYPTKAEVSRWNEERFKYLKTEPVPFATHDSFIWNRAAHPWLESKGDRHRYDNSLKALNDHRFEPRVVLKRGMLVVLLSNLDLNAGLVNGSTGIICGFEPKTKVNPPEKQGSDDKQRSYTVDIINGQVREYISRPQVKVYPVVKFLNVPQPVIIFPECSTHELGHEQTPAAQGEQRASILCRTQIPLMAAWAMTTHKAQGMTLDRVIVDLSRAFEEGQVYVALSRATSLEGLKIEGNANGLLVGAGGNKDVNEWYREKFGDAHLDGEDGESTVWLSSQ
ncbi:hypothetical protein MKZ38_007309 [Zalerion maritima]|uniref:ATP-dependent DNA helicase n=1 Tax=Zalerion maritima TaxID=339359 RepID=A0AAD5RIW6_9PEZI|nr:hypothetical protein MKZ38_007309 [Zalerion maritima]